MAEIFDPKNALRYYRILQNQLRAKQVEPKSGFEVLGVSTGIRPSCFIYLHSEHHTELHQFAHSFDKLALRLELQTVVANPPSLWFPDKETDAIEALRRTEGESIVVWFFREPSTANAIDKATAGEIDAGIVLGYPECCVSWHQAVRKIELTRWRSAKRTSVRGSNEIPLTASDPSAFSPRSASRHRTRTLKNYPFVSHVACNRCLANHHSPTSKLNYSLDKLTKTINPDFHERITRPL